MKRIIGIITALTICITLLAGCRSGLETTLDIADKIDEKYNETSTGQTTSVTSQTTTAASPPYTTIEVILNEIYYIKYSDDKSSVNMYKEASIDSKVIKKIKCKGKESVKVTVINMKNKDIWKVKYKGKTGYIHKKNLTPSKQKSTSAAATTTTYQPTTQPTQWTSQYNPPQTQRQTTYNPPKQTNGGESGKIKDNDYNQQI